MIKKIFGSFAVTAFFAAPLFVACGGSSGVSSGVDGTKKGNELTTEDAQKVCNAIFDYQADKASSVSKADTCAAVGYQTAAIFAALPGATDETLKATCKQIVDTCNSAEAPADDGGTTTDPSAACDSVTDTSVSTCTATVGDIETCTTEQIDAGVAALSGAPACDTLTLDSFGDSSEKPAEPSTACKNVQANCAVIGQIPGLGGGIPSGGDDGGLGGAGN